MSWLGRGSRGDESEWTLTAEDEAKGRTAMKTNEWKEQLAADLERVTGGRPYVLVVYDELPEDPPRAPWKMKTGVRYHVRSTVAPESVECAMGHIRAVVERHLGGESGVVKEDRRG